MRIGSDGVEMGFAPRWLAEAMLWLSSKIRIEVEVADQDRKYRFTCDGRRDFKRYAETLAKEPGTCKWIRTDVKPGETFYDIGANLGLYTIMAGMQVGSAGRVYAFEPHAPNFSQLLRNIVANNLNDVVMPCCLALHNDGNLHNFFYRRLMIGTGHSQIDRLVDADGGEFEKEVCEPKITISLDDLINQHGFLQPDHIKLDVDGNEIAILAGMQKLLSGSSAPKSIQAEINISQNGELVKYMHGFDYKIHLKHFTRQGQRLVDAGHDPEEYGYNAVFKRR